MSYRRKSVFLAEIERQCRFAMKAYSEATAAVGWADEEPLWRSLEALLGSAMRLHQLLWPAPPASSAGAELREALAMPPESPLACRELAALVDLTALVDQWALRSDRGARGFDRERSVVRYYGLTFELPPLLGAIAELEARAAREAVHMREMV